MDLPSEATVTVSVYNLLGQRVRSVERQMGAGSGQMVQLDGLRLASGQYFYRVEADLEEADSEKETAEASGRLTIVR
jgi:hypothetical protein